MIGATAVLLALTSHRFATGQEHIVLVDDGRPASALILPSDPAPDEELAARELRDHIHAMSGARLEIRHADPNDERLAIRIGSSLTPSAETDIRQVSADPASFLVSIDAGGIALAGLSPEGTLFAAYELLEQLGCRWYMPGDLGTVIPKARTVTAQMGKTVQAPSFPHRHLQTVSRDLPWYRRQRLGGMYFPGAHGVGLLPKATFDDEPELFAWLDGERSPRQLCVSNPEVVRRATAWALDYFERNPDAPWVGMGPNDGGGFCECDTCKALDSGEWDAYAAEPSVTDRYIWLFNQILSGVHEVYPDKRIGFYAYHTYKLPPRKHKPSPHIVPALAPITLCRIHGMSNPICPDRSFYRSLMADWGELVPEVFERGYYYNLACPGFPFSKIHAVRDETRVAHEAGITGWRVECAPSWASHGPTLYIAARLMWDVDTDVDAVLDDFAARFFGPAAGPMGEYLTMIDNAYRDTDCHTGASYPMPKVFTDERMRRGHSLLRKAEARAAGDDIFAQRVRMFRLSYEHLDAFRDMLDARNRFDFARAQEALGELREITQTMVDIRLYPSEPTEDEVETPFNSTNDREARLLWWRAARSFVTRFWSPCTESGHERTCVTGELVAGLPDAWDFLVDPTNVGESAGWHRDGPIGGGWQMMRTKTASWSDQGLHY